MEGNLRPRGSYQTEGALLDLEGALLNLETLSDLKIALLNIEGPPMPTPLRPTPRLYRMGSLELFGHLKNPIQVGFSKGPALSLGGHDPRDWPLGAMAQLPPSTTASGYLRAQSPWGTQFVRRRLTIWQGAASRSTRGSRHLRGPGWVLLPTEYRSLKDTIDWDALVGSDQPKSQGHMDDIQIIIIANSPSKYFLHSRGENIQKHFDFKCYA